jgi:hypothetical protein
MVKTAVPEKPAKKCGVQNTQQEQEEKDYHLQVEDIRQRLNE